MEEARHVEPLEVDVDMSEEEALQRLQENQRLKSRNQTWIIIGALVMSFLLASVATYHYPSQNASQTVDNASVEQLSSSSSSSSPNVIFILADDVSWSSMGYTADLVGGDLTFATPFMDSLASQGIILDRYYASLRCTPSRAMLMSGVEAHKLGFQYGNIGSFYNVSLPLSLTTMADSFKNAGYVTHHFGKWNLGHAQPAYLPTQRGFDAFLGYLLGETEYFTHDLTAAGDTFYDLSWETRHKFGEAWGEYWDTYSAFIYESATETVLNETAAKGDSAKPFFIYLAFQNSHSPLTDLSDDWFTDDELDNLNALQGSARRMYAKHLLMLDKQVEQLYNVLEANGQMDNTYIVFASDNGGCHIAGGHTWPLRGVKNTVYEGGVRVPAFVYSPLLPENVQGLNFTGMFSVLDWYPTLASIAGLDISDVELDGVDYSPLLLGTNTSAQRSELVYNVLYNVDGKNYDVWTNGSFAVAKTYDNTTYKLIHANYLESDGPDRTSTDDDDWGSTATCSTNDTGEFLYYLFDVTNDPYETTNLYAKDAYSSILAELYSLANTAFDEAVMCTLYSAETFAGTAVNVWKRNAFNYTVGPFLFNDCGDFKLGACDSSSGTSNDDTSSSNDDGGFTEDDESASDDDA